MGDQHESTQISISQVKHIQFLRYVRTDSSNNDRLFYVPGGSFNVPGRSVILYWLCSWFGSFFGCSDCLAPLFAQPVKEISCH